MQRELQDLEANGARFTPYELLGVPTDADGASIRRAYLEKSKRFHPDAWFRKELGPFGALLSKWFQKLAGAYEILSDEESRSAWDREHRSKLSAHQRAAMERRELSRAEEERRQRERRERMLRTKGFARIGAARKLYEEALELTLNGERTQAIAALKAARELDPRRQEIAFKLQELEREQARARANTALQAGKEREAKQDWAGAISAYTSAFQLDANSSSAAFGIARCAMESGDAHVASTWAARTVDLQPDDVTARMLLARAFVKLNLKAKARAELTQVLNRTPDHKEARSLLRTL